jgi:16S rRNA (guanine527-N7)-methyltransferase
VVVGSLGGVVVGSLGGVVVTAGSGDRSANLPPASGDGPPGPAADSDGIASGAPTDFDGGSGSGSASESLSTPSNPLGSPAGSGGAFGLSAASRDGVPDRAVAATGVVATGPVAAGGSESSGADDTARPVGTGPDRASDHQGAESPAGDDTGPSAACVAEPPWAVPADFRPAAVAFFGDRLPLATEYARMLATDGVTRGLIGPREVPRVWDRHLFNCAALTELLKFGMLVTDIGSGGGLPGVVLALARPDLTVVLVEPMARRTAFLTEVITELGLAHVSVVRARAEDCGTKVPPADVVTARAVAPLDRLAGWCLPLVAVGGRLLALKGATATEEAAVHREAARRLGGSDPVVRQVGRGLIEPSATVIEIVRERVVEQRGASRRP